jgi:hypothetical protein
MKKLTIVFLVLPIGQMVQNESKTNDELVRLTKEYFDAYNNCDVEKIMSFNSTDIEVYTDFAGTTLGHAAVRQQLKNFCLFTSEPDKPTIRVEILGELETYPFLTKDDKIYGGLVHGKLANFTIDKKSGIKLNAGTNEFYFLFKYDNEKWFISRDVSYNSQISKDRNSMSEK